VEGGMAAESVNSPQATWVFFTCVRQLAQHLQAGFTLQMGYLWFGFHAIFLRLFFLSCTWACFWSLCCAWRRHHWSDTTNSAKAGVSSPPCPGQGGLSVRIPGAPWLNSLPTSLTQCWQSPLTRLLSWKRSEHWLPFHLILQELILQELWRAFSHATWSEWTALLSVYPKQSISQCRSLWFYRCVEPTNSGYSSHLQLCILGSLHTICI
jgi:hypothetical protein